MPATSMPKSDLFVPVSFNPDTKATGDKACQMGPEILTFALERRPRATRASVPKVRSGCITCKKRHVKCDESKPSCKRCMKWQGYCEGYGSPSSTKSGNSHAKAAAFATTTASNASNALVKAQPPKERGLNINVFEHGWEKAYFDAWLKMAENVGGGWFQTNVWNKTIPQLSRDCTAVRYAALAVGALANAQSPNMIHQSSKALASLELGSHYKNALTYYGRAMRLVGQQREGKDETVRAAIIACMLFVCFETIHGNHDAAVQHISHGLTIIQQFLHGKKPPGAEASARGEVEARPACTVQPQERLLIEYKEKSPKPLVLEDEILQVFQRLEFQTWSTAIISRDRKGATVPFRGSGDHKPEDIPPMFSDMEEARRWWDLVQHWILHFHRTVREELDIVKAEVAPFDPAGAEKLDLSDMSSTKGLRTKHLHILERWHTSFLPLYAQVRNYKAGDEKAYYQALSLQQQFHLAWVCIRSSSFSNYASMYAMTPKFKEIVRLSAVLLPMLHRTNDCPVPFTLDNGPAMALFIVSTKCRDVDVREEAIALMKKYPRQDGFWSSKAGAVVAVLNRSLEEAYQAEGTLPEQWAKLRQRSAEFLGASRVCVSFPKKDPDTREWVHTDAYLQY